MSGALRDVVLNSVYAETQKLVGAMDVKPRPSRIWQIDQLVRAMRNLGVWDKLDTFYVTAAHTQAAALLNWITPGTNDLTAVNSPTFAIDGGFTGNATNMYLRGYKPSVSATRYTANAACMFIYCNSDFQSNAGSMGLEAGSAGHFFYNRSTTNTGLAKINASTANLSVASLPDRTGLFLLSRDTSTLQTLYRNGTSIGSQVDATPSVPTDFLTWMQDGGGFTSDVVLCAGTGGAMTAQSAKDMYWAVHQYVQAVSGVA